MLFSIIQPFLREDGDAQFAKQKSFMYGHSPSNQVNFYRVHTDMYSYSISLLAHRGMVGATLKNVGGWWMDYSKV